MSIKETIFKRPIISFFSLTFLISWLIWIPIVINYYSNPYAISFSQTSIIIIALAYLGFFGPTIAAMILSYQAGGKKGIANLFSQWKKIKLKLRWYILILATPLIIDGLATLFVIFFNHTYPKITWNTWYSIFPIVLQSMLLGGALAEETGWRGYALPKLLESKNIIVSSLIIGFFWAIWHLPISLIPGANFPIPLTPSLFLMFLMKVVFFSLLFSFFYSRTRGSVFICYLFHSMLNSSLFSSIVRFDNIDKVWPLKYSYSTILYGIPALIIIALLTRTRRKV